MRLIDYINQQQSIAGQSDERGSYRYTISIMPEQISNPKKGYGEPSFIWTGNYTAHLGDIQTSADTPQNALQNLLHIVENLPEPHLRDIERYYRTEPYEDTRSNS